MQHADNLKLLGYWNSLRGTHSAPFRADFEPRDISDIIRTTFLVKFFNDVAMLELVGANIAHNYGYDLKGKTFNQFWLNGVDRLPASLAAKSVEKIIPIEIKADGLTQNGIIHNYEMLLLPLLNHDSTSSWLLGSLVCLDKEHANSIAELAGLSMTHQKPFNTNTIPVDFKKPTKNHSEIIAPQLANERLTTTNHLSLIPGGKKD